MNRIETSSKLYAEGMRLMKTGETALADFRKAFVCFIEGAKLSDRFCVQRLTEVLQTPQYRRRLSPAEAKEAQELVRIFALKLSPISSRGMFTVIRKPVDHAAGMAFQKQK